MNLAALDLNEMSNVTNIKSIVSHFGRYSCTQKNNCNQTGDPFNVVSFIMPNTIK